MQRNNAWRIENGNGWIRRQGPIRIRTQADVELAWDALKAEEAILEEWIEYDFEFSIVAARNSQGELDAYHSIRNEHQNNILDVSISPSGLPSEVNEHATELTFKVMEELGAVGILTIEFFYCDGKVLVNEIAPRPHNSGHLTIEGHVTSQFEQHVRAVCGLKLGSSEQIKPAAMANLLGNVWSDGEPRWHEALGLPTTKLHLYGKEGPRPNRKMGHITATAEETQLAYDQVVAARGKLTAHSDVAKDAPSGV